MNRFGSRFGLDAFIIFSLGGLVGGVGLRELVWFTVWFGRPYYLPFGVWLVVLVDGLVWFGLVAFIFFL